MQQKIFFFKFSYFATWGTHLQKKIFLGTPPAPCNTILRKNVPWKNEHLRAKKCRPRPPAEASLHIFKYSHSGGSAPPAHFQLDVLSRVILCVRIHRYSVCSQFFLRRFRLYILSVVFVVVTLFWTRFHHFKHILQHNIIFLACASIL